MTVFKKFKALFYTCFNESSIHGFPLIVKKQRLFIERLFWLCCISLCIMLTYSICYGQWFRFNNYPVVLSLETNHRSWKFGSPGITICSNYTDREMARRIVERSWNLTRNDPRFEYYEKFVLTVAGTKYYNLEEYKIFANDPSLNNIDLLQVAYEMRQELHELPTPEYSNIITEMGICYSTSVLVDIQRPNKGYSINTSSQLFPHDQIYSSVDIMRLIITPHFLDTGNVTVYVHNKYDVISGADTLHESLVELTDVIHNEIKLHEILSTNALHGLSIKRRKCLFFDEPVLHFFPVYTKNLCRLSCRIKSAIRSCGCIPFFYNLNIPEPTCNATGLYCLSKTSWYSRNCHCYPLCDSNKYVQMYSEKIFYSSYSRFMEITVNYPKSRIKRRIIFSIYELIVSFGGGAAFFLGSSFLSSVEIGFYICEWLCNLTRSCLRSLSKLYYTSKMKRNDLCTKDNSK